MASCGRLEIGLLLISRKLRQADFQSAAGYQPAPHNQSSCGEVALRYSTTSELVIKPELDYATAHAIRAREHRRDLAEIHAIGVLVARKEARVIEQVVEISPKLNALALGDLGIFQDRHVVVVIPGRT